MGNENSIRLNVLYRQNEKLKKRLTDITHDKNTILSKEIARLLESYRKILEVPVDKVEFKRNENSDYYNTVARRFNLGQAINATTRTIGVERLKRECVRITLHPVILKQWNNLRKDTKDLIENQYKEIMGIMDDNNDEKEQESKSESESPRDKKRKKKARGRKGYPLPPAYE